MSWVRKSPLTGFGTQWRSFEYTLQRQATTLITTNYPNTPAALARAAGKPMREETLGDRIGERMRSRLAEMCVEVEMRGSDLRQTVKKARFG